VLEIPLLEKEYKSNLNNIVCKERCWVRAGAANKGTGKLLVAFLDLVHHKYFTLITAEPLLSEIPFPPRCPSAVAAGRFAGAAVAALRVSPSCWAAALARVRV